MLAAAKTFFRWCVMEKKWLARNPLDAVKGIGKVRHGKEQLRIDEARKWMVEAHRQADAGLGHESFKTTAESYAKREAVAGAQQKRVVRGAHRRAAGVVIGGLLNTCGGASNRSPNRD
jgi:hypothetical protein